MIRLINLVDSMFVTLSGTCIWLPYNGYDHGDISDISSDGLFSLLRSVSTDKPRRSVPDLRSQSDPRGLPGKVV